MSASTPDDRQRRRAKTPHTDYKPLDRAKLSPMMRHYVETKDKHPHSLLLYRVGDFFECFFNDALTISRELELVLTSKEGGKEIGRVAMTGVPHHALDRYATQLVEKGYAVAVCDQTEDAADAAAEKRMVERELTRIITPGTILEEGMLSARRNNFLAAVVLAKNNWGLAYADISTGEYYTTQARGFEDLERELSRLQPSEILIPTNAPDVGNMIRAGESRDDLPPQLPNQFCYSLRSQTPFSKGEARSRLLQRFKLGSLEGLGCEHLPLAVRAAGGLLEYLEETFESRADRKDERQKAPRSIPLQRLKTYSIADFLILDSQTRRNLEITHTVRDSTLYGSLLWAIDRTCTAMGSRALRRWLLQPLLEIKGICARHDTVGELLQNTALRQDLQAQLRGIYDIERLAGRAGSGTANAKDLMALAESLLKLPELADIAATGTSPYLRSLQHIPPHLETLAEKIQVHIVESPPLHLKEGNLIRSGVNAQLDELRSSAEGDRAWIANLEVTERDRTGIPNLKVGFNKTFGYYISLPRSKAESAPDDYLRKQTLTNEERYITPELKEREARILTAKDDLNRLEYDIFAELRQEVGNEAAAIRNIAKAVAAIDVLCGFAELASEFGYCRPQMTETREIEIVEGRHPVVEQSLPAGFFVPNSANLGSDSPSSLHPSGVQRTEEAPPPEDTRQNNISLNKGGTIPPPENSDRRGERRSPSDTEESPDLIVLTGPNASGKSCYLRQIGLIQLMAQTGSFVPATRAKLGVCDRIFTRVGAVDDLATGQSTFMVEMNETANILNHAGDRALVLLDEIGRGTATFDGLSIAWAVAEYLATEIRSRTIFATHYHELNELASILPNVANYQVTVKEMSDRIIFLHQVRPGGADRSYGIEAGRLAGLPTPVIARARQVMGEIEKHSKIALGLRQANSSNGEVREAKSRRYRVDRAPAEQLDIFST